MGRVRLLLPLFIIPLIAACDIAPKPLACATYVAGAFNRENRYAFALEAADWPSLGRARGSAMELTLLLARGVPQTVDLVHVVDDRELERWSLSVGSGEPSSATCIISPDASMSTCEAFQRVVPQKPGGYWYLHAGDDVLEAGLSFVLCPDPNGSAVPAGPQQ